MALYRIGAQGSGDDHSFVIRRNMDYLLASHLNALLEGDSVMFRELQVIKTQLHVRALSSCFCCLALVKRHVRVVSAVVEWRLEWLCEWFHANTSIVSMTNFTMRKAYKSIRRIDAVFVGGRLMKCFFQA